MDEADSFSSGTGKAGLLRLAERSDVVIVCCPLTSETKGLVDDAVRGWIVSHKCATHICVSRRLSPRRWPPGHGQAQHERRMSAMSGTVQHERRRASLGCRDVLAARSPHACTTCVQARLHARHLPRHSTAAA